MLSVSESASIHVVIIRFKLILKKQGSGTCMLFLLLLGDMYMLYIASKKKKKQIINLSLMFFDLAIF